MVTHYLDSLMDFDRVVVLDNGEIEEHGSPSSLLGNRDSAFSRLYNSMQYIFEDSKGNF